MDNERTDGQRDPEDEGHVHTSDWLAGVSVTEADQLAALRAQYPRWSIWRGRHTGQFWACPPRPGDLIAADTVTGLGDKIEAAEGRGELS